MNTICPVCSGVITAPAPRSFNGVDLCSPECCSVIMGQVINRDDDVYDADYFLRGRQTGKSLYENYRWLPDLTIPMVLTIAEHLHIRLDDTILDFGCARGYTVKAFRQMGYDAYGYDVSRWAVENADEEVRSYVTQNRDIALATGGYNWIIAKDVLEHIPQVADTINDLMDFAFTGIFVVVPLGEGAGDNYVIDEYEKDVTHIHRFSLSTWASFFIRPGWAVDMRYRIRGIKDNYAQYEKGNGFITARKIIR